MLAQNLVQKSNAHYWYWPENWLCTHASKQLLYEN